MKILLIRHAVAEVPDSVSSATVDDAKRSLTDAGRRRMRKNASRLRRLIKRLDVIGTSGLVRASETAALLGRSYGRAKSERVAALEPGGHPQAVLDWLNRFGSEDTIALVGHEPDLGRLAGYMVCGRPLRVIALKKGGVCLLEYEGEPKPATGMMRWALTPAQLRDLKD